ncbi:MAG: HNH endonuclease [Clostridia bacterium]
MLKEYFSQYLKVLRGVKDSSIRHYFTGLNSINTLLKKYDFPIKDVYSMLTISELELVKEFLMTNIEFRNKDSIGNNMYSVAFNHFYRFACQDDAFFKSKINEMDIIMQKPKQVICNGYLAWQRNQIVVEQVLKASDYSCEYNINHKTFTAKASGYEYMEGHHLIPLRNQEKFKNSLDIYANIVSLCPICHRLLHSAVQQQKERVIEKIFYVRKERLYSSGISLDIQDVLALA